jgi:acetylglutamate kinase
MKQFEYRVEQIQIELKSIFQVNKSLYNKEIADKLNSLGKEGWELAGADGTWFYFKREL